MSARARPLLLCTGTLSQIRAQSRGSLRCAPRDLGR